MAWVFFLFFFFPPSFFYVIVFGFQSLSLLHLNVPPRVCYPHRDLQPTLHPYFWLLKSCPRPLLIVPLSTGESSCHFWTSRTDSGQLTWVKLKSLTENLSKYVIDLLFIPVTTPMCFVIDSIDAYRTQRQSTKPAIQRVTPRVQRHAAEKSHPQPCVNTKERIMVCSRSVGTVESVVCLPRHGELLPV